MILVISNSDGAFKGRIFLNETLINPATIVSAPVNSLGNPGNDTVVDLFSGGSVLVHSYIED